MTALSKGLRYTVQLVFATVLPMVLAVVAVFICAFGADLLRLGFAVTAFPRVGSTPPFVVQVLGALTVGYILGGRSASRPFALWVWILPAAWTLLAIAMWQPFAGATESVWAHFFSGAWWKLPVSPVRSRWVMDQFTHTVPLYTSTAYSISALLRRQKRSEFASRQDVAQPLAG